MQHATIFKILEAFAPLNLAVAGDQCGLQVGSAHDQTRNLLLCVDVDRAAVKKAVSAGANLIISHHPLKGEKGLPTSGPLWEIIKPAIKKDITIYAAHTNFDVATGGLNDWLCAKFGIRETTVLQPTSLEKMYKLVTFTPHAAAEKVRRALGQAGAGQIGEYSQCAFLSRGTGTFLPGQKASPKVGKKYQVNRVDETRLEVILGESKLRQALAALFKTHPYEEPAYDLYPLKNAGRVLGLGRVGKLAKPMNFNVFCNLVKNKLKPDLFFAKGQGKVKIVAVSSGSGKGVVEDVIKSGADTFLTGELNHHARLLAHEFKLNTIEAGHYHTEKCFIEIAAQILGNLPEIKICRAG
jgi:dinuclear metal center YbgI/SA1388 family protein